MKGFQAISIDVLKTKIELQLNESYDNSLRNMEKLEQLKDQQEG